MNTDEIRKFCNRVQTMCDYMDYMKTLHDCNDCAKKNSCEMCPKLGQQVRINCFFWSAENE